MRLSRRARPRAQTFRPAERYLGRGAREARLRGHDMVGTEHVLATLLPVEEGGVSRLLIELGVERAEVEEALACWLEPSPSRIDPGALAALGIDYDSVRERLEESFGAGALEQTRAGRLGVSPRLKLALAFAVDHAGDQPLRDEHVLLGMLSVPDTVVARVLGPLGSRSKPRARPSPENARRTARRSSARRLAVRTRTRVRVGRDPRGMGIRRVGEHIRVGLQPGGRFVCVSGGSGAET